MITREEAKEILEDWNLFHYTPSKEAAEAVISALDPLEIISALRPVSREQVEKVWRGELGEWYFDEFCGEYKDCLKCGARNELPANFCRNCGALLTDEAVQMVMERMKALHEAD